MSTLKLNVQEGFDIPYYVGGKVYKSYINSDNKTIDDYLLCYRFRASGGTPPYIYELVGNTPTNLSLINRPRTLCYDEYADLTLVTETSSDTVTFETSGVKSVGVTCKDSAGNTVTVYGTLTITKTSDYTLDLTITGTTSLYFGKPTWVDKEMTGLKKTGPYEIPRCYYQIAKNMDISLLFVVSGVIKKRPMLRISKKPGFFDFEQPDTEKWIWTLKGRTEALVKDRFYDFTITMEDGPSGNKDVYSPIDMMFFIEGDPNA